MEGFIQECKQLARDIFSTTVALLKIMIPTIILVKIAQELGWVALFGEALAPLMEMLGLPAGMGLVWGAAMLTNLYTGVLMLINVEMALSVAQMTIICSMLLICHGLPLEGIIAKKAGVSFWASAFLRIVAALGFGFLLNLFYQATASRQQLAEIVWKSEILVQDSLADWAIAQGATLCRLFAIIAALITLLRLFRLVKIDKLIAWLLSPLLKLLNVSKQAANLALIGMTLGISYSGGLIINEVQKGKLSKRDIFITIMLLNLLHSLIEDTALVLLLGADFYMIFWGRIFFTLIVMLIVSQIYTLVTKETDKVDLQGQA